MLEDPERVRLALSPLRRELLERFRQPASASQVAAALDLPRQRVGHHVRALEAAGLLELVEERPRRGCTERILRARADAFVVDPSVLGAGPTSDDRHAAEHLMTAATGVVRDVSRMQAAAAEEGTRLLAFTLEAEVAFAAPADVPRFTDRLAEAVAAVVAEFHDPDGRPYRVVAGGHPAPAPVPAPASRPPEETP
ncbi:helix-turn-helix transcriptional regulator [Iamia sp. SCSIO 61187]|nr:helix-turn-helix transcriptional regulator [Iamia sp. SCSIO 61187]